MKESSAPGKLFVLGEYAVLEGAPALLSPVPYRARVSLTSSETTLVSSTGDAPVPLDEARRIYPLLDAVLWCLDDDTQLTNHHLGLDTAEFFSGDVKLGLGSSAALTAAMVKLLMPGKDIDHQYQLARKSHTRFQSGRGSGADVALSIHDQPICFRQGAVETVALPDELHMLAIWSGQPASTTDYLVALSDWQQADSVSYGDHMEKLGKLAETAQLQINSGSISQILATIEQYDRQLAALSSDSGLEFYNSAHENLRKRVELRRCIYKPSGAGGGDFGIAFSADKNELLNLAEELERDKRHTFFLESSI